MKNKKYEPAFIPCGDAFEKMNEISEDELEGVSGGNSNYDMSEGVERAKPVSFDHEQVVVIHLEP